MAENPTISSWEICTFVNGHPVPSLAMFWLFQRLICLTLIKKLINCPEHFQSLAFFPGSGLKRPLKCQRYRLAHDSKIMVSPSHNYDLPTVMFRNALMDRQPLHVLRVSDFIITWNLKISPTSIDILTLDSLSLSLNRTVQ